MTFKRIARFALLAPFLAAAPALAADLPSRSGPPADYYPPPPAFTWTGFYVGVQGGVGFSAFQAQGAQIGGSPTGGLIGLTGGYNYQIAPQFVLGAEADFSFTGVKETHSPFFGAVARGEVDNMLTVRGRAGYVVDRALIYGTAGFAASKNTIGITAPFAGFSGVQSSFQGGWALGAGLEYLFTPNLSAKGEYLFTSTGTGRYFDFTPYALYSGVNTSSVKAGLNVHF
ncbi:MAG: hypothetical protein CTY15_12045 [Methylocystis sp.]|nr:MAG: hypothetical protein CTY15_12045 [Methylocystis sp.]